MHVGIDASNLRDGGGLTHLAGMLNAANPAAQGVTQVSVWGGAAALAALEARPWLVRCHQRALDGGLLRRAVWQRLELAARARAAGCDVLFVPGGASATGFHPLVTMSRNLLPFEWPELARYCWSATGLRLLLLRAAQARTFRHAAGVIFLTAYARETVLRVTGTVAGLSAIVPHGVDVRFRQAPRRQLPIEQYDAAKPLRLLYVSAVELYKHQWHVASAVAQLRAAGLPVRLELVGGGAPRLRAQLARQLEQLDPRREFLHYSGPVPYAQLPQRYLEADLGVFASSCENMPNILLEAMAAGLPLACSQRGPMPEVLGDAGVYFDPERPQDIARALRELLASPQLRARLAQAAYLRAQVYGWERCAAQTFEFLGRVARTQAARGALLERC